MPRNQVDRSTIFSPCREYRYTLWRDWHDLFGDDTYVAFICLNPSTADEIRDDPTVRRCVEFSKSWGYSAFCMLNAFAYRATDPRIMKYQRDPVGPENDSHILRVAAGASVVVAAWGTHCTHMERNSRLLKMLHETPGLPPLQHLKLTKDGHPNHPLYLPANLRPEHMQKQPVFTEAKP